MSIEKKELIRYEFKIEAESGDWSEFGYHSELKIRCSSFERAEKLCQILQDRIEKKIPNSVKETSEWVNYAPSYIAGLQGCEGVHLLEVDIDALIECVINNEQNYSNKELYMDLDGDFAFRDYNTNFIYIRGFDHNEQNHNEFTEQEFEDGWRDYDWLTMIQKGYERYCYIRNEEHLSFNDYEFSIKKRK